MGQRTAVWIPPGTDANFAHFPTYIYQFPVFKLPRAARRLWAPRTSLGTTKKRRERTSWKGKQGRGVGVIYKTWKEGTQTEAGGEYTRELEV
jgi:hypothetical protein